jgi:hypothetical protein
MAATGKYAELHDVIVTSRFDVRTIGSFVFCLVAWLSSHIFLFQALLRLILYFVFKKLQCHVISAVIKIVVTLPEG